MEPQRDARTVKLSELQSGLREEPEQSPYRCSELAEPAITLAEARAVDLARDTTVCRWHRGQQTHLNVDGKVYFCPIGGMYWRYTKQASEFLKALPYRC